MSSAHDTEHEVRVLVVTHLFPTEDAPLQGPWVAEQVDALSEYVNIGVLCCSQLTSNRSETRTSGVRVDYRSIATPFGRGRVGLIFSTLRYWVALARFLRTPARRPDLVHAHFGFPDAVVTSLVCSRANIPFVVTLHGDDAFRLVSRRDFLGRTIRAALIRARRVICVSEAMAKVVRAEIPQNHVVTVPNGYNDRLFQLSESERDGGLLFVGALLPVKNVETLLRSYALAIEKIDLSLTIAGDGPLRSKLENLTAALGIAEQVFFVGPQPRECVATLMKHAKALVLPSKSEGWGLVVAESLGVGTPVVASRVGGIPEIVTLDSAGVLVEPDDVEALAEAVIQVSTYSWNPRIVREASGARPWSEQARHIATVYVQALDSKTRTSQSFVGE